MSSTDEMGLTMTLHPSDRLREVLERDRQRDMFNRKCDERRG